MGTSIDLLPVTQKTWTDGGSSYGGQKNSDLSTLVGLENVIEVREAVRGVGATKNPPPQPYKGEPLVKVRSPPFHNPHLQPRGSTPLKKGLAHPGSLRKGGWVNAAVYHAPPLTNTTAYPRGGPLETFQQGPGDA